MRMKLTVKRVIVKMRVIILNLQELRENLIQRGICKTLKNN